MIQRIQSLAKKYEELTGFRMRESYLMQCEAREWLEAGFTEDDLVIVILYIRKKVDSERIRQSMLRWSFLIGNPVRFEEELHDARAEHRNRKPATTERHRVLEATGRHPDHFDKAGKKVPCTAGQVMSESGAKAFEEFKKFRRTLE